MMTHAPIKLKRVWTQETEKGFLVKGATPSGRILYLKRMYAGVWDFLENPDFAAIYAESTASHHAAEISAAITKGRPTSIFELTDNRAAADLLFVMLINGKTFAGVFDRAEKAEQAVNEYNASHEGNPATYIDVTDTINQIFEC